MRMPNVNTERQHRNGKGLSRLGTKARKLALRRKEEGVGRFVTSNNKTLDAQGLGLSDLEQLKKGICVPKAIVLTIEPKDYGRQQKTQETLRRAKGSGRAVFSWKLMRDNGQRIEQDVRTSIQKMSNYDDKHGIADTGTVF